MKPLATISQKTINISANYKQPSAAAEVHSHQFAKSSRCMRSSSRHATVSKNTFKSASTKRLISLSVGGNMMLMPSMLEHIELLE
jgi:hypothetical protein